MIGLRPDEYWAATPVELSEMLAGAAWRDEREWERSALIATQVINMAGKLSKRTVTIDELLGRKQPFNHDEATAQLAARLAEIEAQDAAKTNEADGGQGANP